MNPPEILQRLCRLIADSASAPVDPASITEATSLESFAVDSLVLIDLIFDIEQEFGVKLVVGQLINMRTMGDLVSHLATRIGT
ncbi:MAG: acyl carrier protein [Opitutaceae bacterium]